MGGNPTEDGYGFNAITPSGLVNVGSWACTAGVIEGDDIRLYVDGTEYELPEQCHPARRLAGRLR